MQTSKQFCPYIFLISFSLILEKDDSILGFAMGYFKQYDDNIGYTLEEIIIAYEYQNQGIGSTLLRDEEKQCNINI